MAATELLDFNQVVEQSSTNGDSPSSAGGLMTWNFRCDPNLAWDPSQSYFAMDITFGAKTAGTSNAANNYAFTDWAQGMNYWMPDGCDFYPFFPLRAFSSMSHIIDGVTVAHTNQPYADKIMQEKYLHDTSLSNYGNFESLLLARAIDDFEPAHNLVQVDRAMTSSRYDALETPKFWVKKKELSGRIRDTGNATYTFFFQPPFDMWTKHQRISGGNHQIQLDLKTSTTLTSGDGSTIADWGDYFNTGAGRISDYALSKHLYSESQVGYYASYGSQAADVNSFADVDAVLNGTAFGRTGAGVDKSMIAQFVRSDPLYFGGGSATNEDTVKLRQRVFVMQKKSATIERIRLLRRMVRFTVERPIGSEEFNCTEMQFFTGTPSTSGMTQNFLLPSSTFGIAFYWRKASNSYYDVIDDYPKIVVDRTQYTDGDGSVVALSADHEYEEHSVLNLNNFYFTYGGQTYPAQRISNIYGSSSSGVAPGCYKMHAITHMLQGVLNTDQERYNTTFAGVGLMDRMDASSFFFPVAKHNNSDNSDLQVTWDGQSRTVQGTAVTGPYTLKESYAGAFTASALSASLVVVAFYDTRTELSYNGANQLEKVTKTEWK